MAQSINELMTHDPHTVEADASLVEAARAMKAHDVGDVLVTEGGGLAGIVTDRDIVGRAGAAGRDPPSVTAGEVCSRDVHTLTPDQSVDDAIELVRRHDVRRVPVVQDGRPVGIVSLGDLAIARDPDSALADISAAAGDD